MKLAKYLEYKKSFKSAVWIKGRITAKHTYHRQLVGQDKHGSHVKAIIKALKELEDLKSKLAEKLEGHDYAAALAYFKKANPLYIRYKNMENQTHNGKRKKELLKKRLEALKIEPVPAVNPEDEEEDFSEFLDMIPERKPKRL